MAEQLPIPQPDLKREILLLVVLGFGSLVYSFGALSLYAEPEARPVTIALQARAKTEPRGAGGTTVDTSVAAQPAAATAPETTSPAPPAPPTPASKPEVPAAPAASPTPPPSAATSADTLASRSETAPVTAPVSPPTAASKPTPAKEQVRIVRQRVGGEWVEVHDFTHGVTYRGEVHDFRSGEAPVWMREGRPAPVRETRR